jgi:hypothetical protein
VSRLEQPGAALRSWPRSVGRGFAEWKTVGVLFFATCVVAGLMVAPALRTVWAHFGHAPLAVGEPLVSPGLLLGLGEVFRDGGAPSIGAPLVLIMALQLLLTGGVVWRVWTVDPFRLGDFLAQSGRLLGRNVRLFLWSLAGLLAALLLIGGSAALLHAVHRDSVFTLDRDAWLFGQPFTRWSVGHLAFASLCLAAWRLSLESGRVLVFRDDLRQTRRAAWRGFRVALRSPLSLALYLLLGWTATLAVFSVARLRASLPEGTSGHALVALLVGQVAIWVRLSFQVAGVAFAAELVRRRASAPVVLAPAPAAEPAAMEAAAEVPLLAFAPRGGEPDTEP